MTSWPTVSRTKLDTVSYTRCIMTRSATYAKKMMKMDLNDKLKSIGIFIQSVRWLTWIFLALYYDAGGDDTFQDGGPREESRKSNANSAESRNAKSHCAGKGKRRAI